MATERFDFSILSIHTADKKGLHDGAFFADRSIETSYEKYYKELLYCVKNFKYFSILGHLDLVKRYTIDEIPKADFHGIIQEICKKIIPSGKGIEINTSGTRYGLPRAMPSDDIVKLYKANGGEIITIGSDAHQPDDIGYAFKPSLELLESLGFKYVTTFNDMKPTFHKIDRDRKSTRLNSSHVAISYAVFCLKKKQKSTNPACRACMPGTVIESHAPEPPPSKVTVGGKSGECAERNR